MKEDTTQLIGLTVGVRVVMLSIVLWSGTVP